MTSESKHSFTNIKILNVESNLKRPRILSMLNHLLQICDNISVNISFPPCISLIAVSLSFVAVSIFFFSFVVVSIFFFSYLISVIAVYPLILSKDLNYCLGLGLKGSDYDD
jgi:hypothetical protein